MLCCLIKADSSVAPLRLVWVQTATVRGDMLETCRCFTQSISAMLKPLHVKGSSSGTPAVCVYMSKGPFTCGEASAWHPIYAEGPPVAWAASPRVLAAELACHGAGCEHQAQDLHPRGSSVRWAASTTHIKEVPAAWRACSPQPHVHAGCPGCREPGLQGATYRVSLSCATRSSPAVPHCNPLSSRTRLPHHTVNARTMS